MNRLCENCKHWVAVDSMENWGVCAKNENSKKKGKGKFTGVLRRCDENCRDYKSTPNTEPARS